MKILKIFALLSTALVLISCSFIVDLPIERTGATQTFEINEALEPDAESSTVIIEMGGGNLNLDSGSDALVDGVINYNFPGLKPTIIRDGSEVKIIQKADTTISLPQGKLVNDWELKLGTTPLDLRINSGAYEGNLNLGGLAINNLSISDGASSSRVYFDAPNPVVMSQFSYTTGASDVELHGLGNANVSQINFGSGVGNYTLDFTGENKIDCEVFLKSGVSNIKIIIPENARAEVNISGGLSDVNLMGTWTVVNNQYSTGSEGGLIRINIDMAVGELALIAE